MTIIDNEASCPLPSCSCTIFVMCRSTPPNCICSWDSGRENPQAGYPKLSKNHLKRMGSEQQRNVGTVILSGYAPMCVRALVEPLDRVPNDAVAHAEAIERELATGGLQLEQIHHGDSIVSWGVNRRTVERGHGIRTGLEDTPVLPDGRLASGNADLVAAAAALLAEQHD